MAEILHCPKCNKSFINSGKFSMRCACGEISVTIPTVEFSIDEMIKKWNEEVKAYSVSSKAW